jgi:hypothetical protein
MPNATHTHVCIIPSSLTQTTTHTHNIRFLERHAVSPCKVYNVTKLKYKLQIEKGTVRQFWIMIGSFESCVCVYASVIPSETRFSHRVTRRSTHTRHRTCNRNKHQRQLFFLLVHASVVTFTFERYIHSLLLSLSLSLKPETSHLDCIIIIIIIIIIILAYGEILRNQL